MAELADKSRNDTGASAAVVPPTVGWLADFTARNPTVVFGGGLLAVVIVMAVIAPLITPSNPLSINPMMRLNAPSMEALFGTDMLGRDVYSRVVYGARISLMVGISVAVMATIIGLVIGLIAGYVRILDGIFMRIMDGLMAIPSILLAIALMALVGSSVRNVIIAITIPEIPRVVRLVRGMVLSLREQPFVEAAVAIGTPTHRIVFRHILPNTIAPLLVQATYICASAIIIEAYLSFLGAGTPPEVPSWGNIMAEGRQVFQLALWIVLFPGTLLAMTVLAINALGDGLRDMLDPQIARRM